MNNRIQSFALAFASASILLAAGCGDSAEAKSLRTESGEALEAAKSWSAAKMKDLSASLSSGWESIEGQCAKLKEAAADKGEATKEKMQSLISSVREKAAAMKDKVADAADAGTEESRDALKHAQEAYESAKTSLAQAFDELKK